MVSRVLPDISINNHLSAPDVTTWLQRFTRSIMVGKPKLLLNLAPNEVYKRQSLPT